MDAFGATIAMDAFGVGAFPEGRLRSGLGGFPEGRLRSAVKGRGCSLQRQVHGERRAPLRLTFYLERPAVVLHHAMGHR